MTGKFCNFPFLATFLVATATNVTGIQNTENVGKLTAGEKKTWKAIGEIANKQNAELKALLAEYSANEDMINSLTSKNHAKRQSNLQIAFTATLDKSSNHFQAQQALLFDQVLTNIGGYYNPSSGVFLAPTNGLYHFSVTVGSLGGNTYNISAEIVQNGVPKVRIHATTHGHDMGHQSIVLKLMEGDKVWVRHQAHARDSGSVQSGFSTFSGHLVSQIQT